MSVRINQTNCIGCGLCIEACPGNLIKKNQEGKAYLPHPKDCWACTSCLKECSHAAISMFLGADMGGRGETLRVKKEKEELIWEILTASEESREIRINQKEANKY